MEPNEYIDPALTKPDLLVLKNLLQDIDETSPVAASRNSSIGSATALEGGAVAARNGHSKLDSKDQTADPPSSSRDQAVTEQLTAFNNPKDERFYPTVAMMWDFSDIKLPGPLHEHVFLPYVRWARRVVRVETDVVMLNHLALYFSTSLMSMLYLYRNFSWVHGVLHTVMQVYYAGTYTLMMHQHIHMGGILAKQYAWFDHAFPYLTDPLMGHTWNSYFYHHVKHHHVEGNGPLDKSSTIRYQRDDPLHFLHYVLRFMLFVWIELPLYFISKNQFSRAIKAGGSELANYVAIYLLATCVNFRATLFAFILPLLIMRLGLMVGNWGQHAFVDENEPDSDFRSSITLIDVPSNRFCFNDGYHTSHHLNPKRHWRDHPLAFHKQKGTYAAQNALVFRNIDYLMITFRTLRKDYDHLAKCLVPIGAQVGMSLPELADMLRTKTKRFSEEDIRRKFHSESN